MPLFRRKKGTEKTERDKAFDDFLNGIGSSKPKICDSCTYVIHGKRGGYENPCKKGHYGSGADKEFCKDHPDPKYHSKTKL